MTIKDEAPRRGRMSDTFMKRIEGDLKPLVEYVSSHKELDIQLRDNYFNVYYDGGNILKVSPQSLFFDPWYFYNGWYKGVKIPKTYIEEQVEKKPRDNSPKNYPTSDLANEIYESIVKKKQELLKIAENGDYESYFDETKSFVDKWVEKDHNRLEREKQHIIACSNRRFTPNNNLVVIDLEFAVSTLKP